jgi:hypothetical protein
MFSALVPGSGLKTDIAAGPFRAKARNRCAIARCAGSPTASAVPEARWAKSAFYGLTVQAAYGLAADCGIETHGGRVLPALAAPQWAVLRPCTTSNDTTQCF